MYELIILGHLMRNPMHGYLMARIINDMIGPYARVSNGRFYPLLAKLEADGFIAATTDVPKNDRRQRTYTVTDAGCARLHGLMLDTTTNPGEYARYFWLKLSFFDTLSPEERLYLLDHYLNYCQTHIFHLMREMTDLEQEVARLHFMTPEQLAATLEVMRHRLARWQLDQAHTAAWRERERASHGTGFAAVATPQMADRPCQRHSE